ncbi:MAG: hypothetical protein JOZ77_10775 [Candidatus Eremiobacteraeota bacterium]|nr:hypothetical protein [Candidatus Eremiobacteraeota bacterium]
MSLLNLLTVLAIVLPSPTSSPEPRTIITVTSSPYCRSLATHFDDALVPMLANDRTLTGVGVQLDQLNTLFDQPNYEQLFFSVRDSIGRQEVVLNRSLAAIQSEINALRQGSSLTTDPQAAAQVHLAAQNLQTAYDHQRQLAIDLQEMHRYMLNYPIARVHPAMGGFDPQEMAAPQAARDVKSYLHFNAQRDIIGVNEDRAADAALSAADKYCSPQQ